jgi:peptidylprolyl isomerase
MNAKNNDWVSIEYTGKIKDKIFDSNVGKEPLIFKLGAQMVIPGFEKAVLELKVSEEKEILIPSKEAYGELRTESIELPKEVLGNIDIKENEEKELMTNVGPLLVKVLEIKDDKVKAILNHPLAGKDLTFKIKLLKILDKKEVKEIEEQMTHQSCSCGHDHSCEDCNSEHEHNHECECDDDCDCDHEHN